MSRQPRNPTHTHLAIGEEPDTRPRVLSFEVILPFPPSINHLYWSRAVGKRVMVGMTKDGVAYKESVEKTIGALLGNRRAPAPYYRVTIRAFPPDRRKHDLDNLLKIISDSVFGAINADDNDVIDLHITKPRPDLKPDAFPRIVVTVEGEVDA